MDIPNSSNIERGDRPAKREQVVALTKLLFVVDNELLTLWLADKVLEVLVGERELADKALNAVQGKINQIVNE